MAEVGPAGNTIPHESVFFAFLEGAFTPGNFFGKLFMELLIARVVSNMRMQAYTWVVTPRKNMDIKMTEGDASFRINDTCEYIKTNDFALSINNF